jgi:hypothetical protein
MHVILFNGLIAYGLDNKPYCYLIIIHACVFLRREAGPSLWGDCCRTHPPPPPTPSAPPRMFGKQILISAEKLSANAILRPPSPCSFSPFATAPTRNTKTSRCTWKLIYVELQLLFSSVSIQVFPLILRIPPKLTSDRRPSKSVTFELRHSLFRTQLQGKMTKTP